jgi:hypothetical protein
MGFMGFHLCILLNGHHVCGGDVEVGEGPLLGLGDIYVYGVYGV